ncbi:ankyrin repeat-containing protein [Phlyctema vagabunda]|uniref:Ankyrin repeat-containing protein n=1 Tax=Phlyctema vagabunda TaxID=108571 RepID=A0ABR4P2R1_9HELO
MSGALVPSTQSGSNFAQQGSVDWVALSNTTVHFSVEILSRFSKAGVEMITIAVGQALFQNFNVPAEGQKRHSDAISKLKAISSYGEVLWFGFGIKHVVRTLCETEQGATCAAICACLSVSYDTFCASNILKAIADSSKTPNSLTPSLSQWGALTRVCAGSVENSTFPNAVEGFSRLLRLPPNDCRAITPLCEPAAPKVIADALLELCKVSNGAQRSVTFEGGVDCGWLAAISQWLLCLRIEIVDTSGELLYRNWDGNNGQYPQVTIIRNLILSASKTEPILVSRSFYVPAGKIYFGSEDRIRIERAECHLYSPGRSSWDSILHETFGEPAKVLLDPKHAVEFYHFLCSAFIFPMEFSLPQIKVTPWGILQHSTVSEIRKEFLSFAMIQFPELRYISEVAKSVPVLGQEGPEAFARTMEDLCTCEECKKKHDYIADPRICCLVNLGITIMRLLLLLSWSDIDSSIKPSPNGLLLLYNSCWNQDLHNRLRQGRQVKARLDQVRNETFLGSDYTQRILSLFTGFDNSTFGKRDVSAVSEQGICVFSRALKDIDFNPQQLLRYSLIPGQIEFSGRTYQYTEDIQQDAKRVNHIKYEPPNLWVNDITAIPEWKLVVEETLDSSGLRVGFEVTRKFSFRFSIGVNSMRKVLLVSIQSTDCWNREVKVKTKADATTEITWVGKCRAVRSYLSANSENTLPKQDEWVILLLDWERSHDNIIVLRGSYKELYGWKMVYQPSPETEKEMFGSMFPYVVPIVSCAFCSIIRSDRKDFWKEILDKSKHVAVQIYVKLLSDTTSFPGESLGTFECLPESKSPKLSVSED